MFIKAKKSLGQNFLIDKNIINKIISLSEQLQNKFFNDVCIINKDILKIDEKNISKNKLLVFGNLPYNISTEIICSWVLKLEKNFWFTDLILMFYDPVTNYFC